jgi:hypothetical protein
MVTKVIMGVIKVTAATSKIARHLLVLGRYDDVVRRILPPIENHSVYLVNLAVDFCL